MSLREACLSWVQEHDDAMAMLFPDRLPMLVKPDEWSNPSDGGYVLPELRHTTPLIIKSRLNPQAGLKRYHNADMPQVYRAVNAMQNTPWRINTRVLEVMKEVWTKNLGVGMPSSEPLPFPPCPLAPGAKPENDEGRSSVHSMEARHARSTRSRSRAQCFVYACCA